MGNCSSSRFDANANLARVNRIITWSVAIVLVLVAIIYAGERGYSAYHHTPAVQIDEVPQIRPIPFPAITICPVEQVPITTIECEYEMSQTPVASCLGGEYSRAYTFEGKRYECYTYNDPQDGSAPVASTSVNDEIELEIFIDPSNVKEDFGALCMVHPQGTAPELELEASFIADIGVDTLVLLRKDVLQNLDGTTEDEFSATHSSAKLKSNTTQTMYSVELTFAFAEQTVFYNNQYYVYNRNNWIGEVGGFVCFLYFIHLAVTYITITIVARVCFKASQARSYQENLPENYHFVTLL